MRTTLDRKKLDAFIREVGLRAQGPGRVYLVGGATALLLNIRQQTIDIDLKLDPEPRAIFEAIALLKEKLELNVELAAPDQFLPPLPGWIDRSEFIVRSGQVDFYHYDFYSQVLSKLLRGHAKDLADAEAIVALRSLDLRRLRELFESIEGGLVRYPAISHEEFRRRVMQFIEDQEIV
jgi:hypothetical protein